MMANESAAPSLVQEVMDAIPNHISNTTENDVIAMATNAENLAMTRFIVQRVLVPVVTSIGVFGNVISICVLAQRCMVSSTNWYLKTLAVFDLMYLLFSFTLSLKHYESVKGQVPYAYWFPYGRALTDICSNVSVCLTVTFSLERLIAVCYPMKGRIVCTAERARLITFIVSFSAICCTAPEFFEWKTIEVIKDNRTQFKNVISDVGKSASYQVGYYYFIVVVFTVLPLILLSTFNGLLIRSVIAATRIRKQMVYTSVHSTKDTRRRQGEEHRITIMLILVVIVFLICQFPNAALILYTTYLTSEQIDLSNDGINNVIIAGNVVNLLVLINASVNFILYSAMSTKFRRVALRMFCRFLQRRRYKPQFTRTEMSYYNSAASVKLHGAPLRFRSMRVENKCMNGMNGMTLNGYCTAEMKPNRGAPTSRESSRTSYDSSNKSMKTAMTRSSSNSDTHGRTSTADGSPVDSPLVHVINGDTCMHETKLIKNALIIWKGNIPLGNVHPGGFEGAKSINGDNDISLNFKLSTTHMLAKKMRGRSRNHVLFDDTSL